MNADSKGGREHPVAVLEPDPKVWMTMTEPKAAQAVATTSEPRQRASATDQATMSGLDTLEKEPRCLTWCKQVMVGHSNHQIKRPRTKHQRPKTDADTESTESTRLPKSFDRCGVRYARAFPVCTSTVLPRSRPRVSSSRLLDTLFVNTRSRAWDCVVSC
jgi:hypothetical protein